MTQAQKVSLDNLIDYSTRQAPCIENLHQSVTALEIHTHSQEAISLTQDDIVTAHDEGYKQGYAKAKAEAISEAEIAKRSKETALLDRIHNALQTAYKPILHENEQNQRELTKASSRYLKDSFARMNIVALPDTIEALLKPIHDAAQAQSNIFKWLKVCVHPDDIVIVTNTMNEHQSRIDIPISFKADPSLNQGDCLIEWQDGLIEHRFSNAAHHIDHIFSQFNLGKPPLNESVS